MEFNVLPYLQVANMPNPEERDLEGKITGNWTVQKVEIWEYKDGKLVNLETIDNVQLPYVFHQNGDGFVKGVESNKKLTWANTEDTLIMHSEGSLEPFFFEIQEKGEMMQKWVAKYRDDNSEMKFVFTAVRVTN